LENPAYLLGIPLVLISLLGLVIAASLFAIPADTAGGQPRAAARHAGAHPEPAEYVVIGIILAAITAVEVALYYIDLAEGALVGLLLILSIAKFGFVIAWFMHLKFDNKLFTTLFLGGLGLAISVFIVAVATLDGNLI
jgi:cytochrome c oxidase subunit 4